MSMLVDTIDDDISLLTLLLIYQYHSFTPYFLLMLFLIGKFVPRAGELRTMKFSLRHTQR